MFHLRHIVFSSTYISQKTLNSHAGFVIRNEEAKLVNMDAIIVKLNLDN